MVGVVKGGICRLFFFLDVQRGGAGGGGKRIYRCCVNCTIIAAREVLRTLRTDSTGVLFVVRLLTPGTRVKNMRSLYSDTTLCQHFSVSIED